jgi:hypothetical protein
VLSKPMGPPPKPHAFWESARLQRILPVL